MSRINFNIEAELSAIEHGLFSFVWSNYDKDVMGEFSNKLSSELIGITKKYRLYAGDLRSIHGFLDKMLISTNHEDLQKAIDDFDESIFGHIFSASNQKLKPSEKEFAEAIQLIRHQVDNAYISEKRKRRIPFISLIVSILSIGISIISIVVALLLSKK